MITAEQVRLLREKTGLGMMLCKAALTETGGDMEKAIENLRKQGEVTAAKRAGKTAKEGTVAIRTDSTSALMYEVNCETDFVARNDDFIALVENLGTLLMTQKPADINAAKAIKSDLFDGLNVEDKLVQLIGKIGENISFRRFVIEQIDGSKERIYSYVHGNGKIGVLVKLSAGSAAALDSEAMATLGKDIAMQIAAATPIAVSREKIPADLIEKEREIYRIQAQNSGKPEKIWDKIVEGKLAKYYQEFVLPEQQFIRNPEITVADRIKEVEKQTQTTIKAEWFARFERGGEE